MIDRGIIKWQPFNSCFSSSKILKELNYEKNKIEFPILSEDQLSLLEDKIKNAYFLKQNIKIKYYYNEQILEIIGKINNINLIKKNILINNKIIHFKQIIQTN